MENASQKTVSKRQAKFHRAIGLAGQVVGCLMLIAMWGAFQTDRGNTDWSGVGPGVFAFLYLVIVGRWAYAAYRDGEATPAARVRVVRWLNFVSFLIFVATVLFLIGNIFDPYLYKKVGF